MARTKYWRLRLKGRLSADEAGASLPEGATHILRVDQEADETYVYYATTLQPGAAKTARAARGSAAEEVSLKAVMKID
jgi:hypothetical protein